MLIEEKAWVYYISLASTLDISVKVIASLAPIRFSQQFSNFHGFIAQKTNDSI
jgi:hypothetical protein